MLINEVHSYGQIFSGCIWDVIANIFNSTPPQNEASLLAAAQTTGELLVAACGKAPLKPRFFKSVGQTMILSDNELNDGHNADAIVQAFSNHGIDLEQDTILEPMEPLSGRAPELAAAKGSNIITRASRRDIIDFVGETEGQRFFVRPEKMGAVDVAVAQQRYYIPLDDVAEELAGVEAQVRKDILLGDQDGRAVILGAAPTVHETNNEVQHFVRNLVDNESIALETDPTARANATHRVVHARNRKVLQRIGFSY